MILIAIWFGRLNTMIGDILTEELDKRPISTYLLMLYLIFVIMSGCAKLIVVYAPQEFQDSIARAIGML